jgi:hypothetical protein
MFILTLKIESFTTVCIFQTIKNIKLTLDLAVNTVCRHLDFHHIKFQYLDIRLCLWIRQGIEQGGENNGIELHPEPDVFSKNLKTFNTSTNLSNRSSSTKGSNSGSLSATSPD